MATLSLNTPRDYELGDLNHLPVIATDIIFEGAAVGDNASGYMRPLVAGDPFRGFAVAKADNAAGAAGAINVELRTKGRIMLAISGLAIDDVGKAVYASDDAVFTLTIGSNSHIGRVVRWVSSGYGIVEFASSGAGAGVLTELTNSTGVAGDDTIADGLTTVAVAGQTAAALTGTLTGTVDGVLADVADIALSTTDTYADSAVNTAVNAAILAVNLQLKELQTQVNAAAADLADIYTAIGTLLTDVTAQNGNDSDLATKLNAIMRMHG